jgi:tRNA(fMet)-specific endonuclease VapC
MHRYMLDTNTASYFLKNKSAKLNGRLANLKPNETVCISAISEGELRFGIAKNPQAMKRQRTLDAFLALAEVLPWTNDEAAIYGDLRAKQQAAGKPLSPLDMLIAAHAVSIDATLVTNDQAFQQVPTLRVVHWATDI